MFLHIGAASHTSRVFLDGDELPTHAGGFSPYAVELMGRLAPGEHSLVIQVDSRREPDRIPAMGSGWWNFSGLTRSTGTTATVKPSQNHLAIHVRQANRLHRNGWWTKAGLSPWILKDFCAPVRVFPGIQDGDNRKGLLSEEGEWRPAFDVLRNYCKSLD